MRIAITTLYLPSGSKIGVGYQVHDMANALVKRGHSVEVFSPCFQPSDALYGHTRVDIEPPLRVVKLAWQLRRLDFSDFDVVHSHGEDYLMKRSRVRWHVRTMHGSSFAEMIRVSGTKEKARMLFLGLTEIAATRVADTTVCVSHNTRWWYGYNLRVIPNGICTETFEPGPSRTDFPSILFVGTYRNRKRGSVLVDIFQKEIHRRIPDSKLWMVCEDAPDLPGVVRFGRIGQSELVDLYQRAWVFCLPSSYEAFGIPYIEAMACGTPVVASINPGSRELINSAVGDVVPDAELADAICRRLEGGPPRQSTVEACRAEAAKYSWDRVLSMYELVYQRRDPADP